MSIASTYTADLSKNCPKIDISGKYVDEFDMSQIMCRSFSVLSTCLKDVSIKSTRARNVSIPCDSFDILRQAVDPFDTNYECVDFSLFYRHV